MQTDGLAAPGTPLTQARWAVLRLILGVAQMIAWLSRTITLVPGDIIATGTPAGIGGIKGIFLRDGNTVEVEVEGLGKVSNPVRLAA